MSGRKKNNLRTPFTTRQYMNARDYELYYYNDSNPVQTKEHAHDYYEFYFFLEGAVSLAIDGVKYPLRYGDVVLIPPGVMHQAVIHAGNKPYRRFVFWISMNTCNSLMQESVTYGYLFQQVQTRKKDYIIHNDMLTFHMIESRIFRLLEELSGSRFGKDAECAVLMRELILFLSRLVHDQAAEDRQKEYRDLYEGLLEYLDVHISEELSLDNLAETFHVSKYYISHLFKNKMGISMHQYIVKKRLSMCRDAIAGGGKISEIFLQYGFSDYSGFYRAFKKEYGITPQKMKEDISKISTKKNIDFTTSLC